MTERWNNRNGSVSGKTIIGNNNEVKGNDNTGNGMNNKFIGNRNTVSGMNATVIGDRNTVSGMNAIVHGNNNTVTGMNASVSGINNTVVGMNSTNNGIPVSEETHSFGIVTGNGVFVINNSSNLVNSSRNRDRDRPVVTTVFPEACKDEPVASNSEEECYVCLERKKVVFADTCGHSAGCVTCCRILKESGAKSSSGKHLCPECRGEVVKFIKVFV
jgi:hypothetical protein